MRTDPAGVAAQFEEALVSRGVRWPQGPPGSTPF
jgi:hypothetical protein